MRQGRTAPQPVGADRPPALFTAGPMLVEDNRRPEEHSCRTPTVPTPQPPSPGRRSSPTWDGWTSPGWPESSRRCTSRRARRSSATVTGPTASTSSSTAGRRCWPAGPRRPPPATPRAAGRRPAPHDPRARRGVRGDGAPHRLAANRDGRGRDRPHGVAPLPTSLRDAPRSRARHRPEHRAVPEPPARGDEPGDRRPPRARATGSAPRRSAGSARRPFAWSADVSARPRWAAETLRRTCARTGRCGRADRARRELGSAPRRRDRSGRRSDLPGSRRRGGPRAESRMAPGRGRGDGGGRRRRRGHGPRARGGRDRGRREARRRPRDPSPADRVGRRPGPLARRGRRAVPGARHPARRPADAAHRADERSADGSRRPAVASGPRRSSAGSRSASRPCAR